MCSFHNVIIPDFIAMHAQGGPVFNTYCIATSSGREHRYVNWHFPLQKYIINNCYLSIEQLELLNSFFRARKGMAFSFLMKDYADYFFKHQPIDLESITDNQFQLVKNYAEGGNRKITKPITQSIQIKDEDNQTIPFAVDCNTGIITLTHGYDTTNQLYISCEFNVPVRFNSDMLVYKVTPEQVAVINNLELIEVL